MISLGGVLQHQTPVGKLKGEELVGTRPHRPISTDCYGIVPRAEVAKESYVRVRKSARNVPMPEGLRV